VTYIESPKFLRTTEEAFLMKYEIILYWSEDDNAYIAEVPELAGCMADGQTAGEALQNVEQIAKEWIETALELGREIPEPKGRLKYA
jgi:predicted RNase H-like HicB family nuclease